ncbi:Succinate-semialdehyde dehydrogenase [NADP+] [Salisediminibacterium beveridgei]|uniref:Succinate-semialdehyde dehydrogenase [NADP+] n=2 Tax=Salisediminibacterium beveridgei TaxID=632773 RepID=A0A1D7QS87_9BACI|nr:Succinate-semialdehyde dehydrogenase [NADP+] [Salisediminibacterium beveridgei]
MDHQEGREDDMDGKLYINGEWQEADSGERIDVLNPATGERVGTAAFGGQVETKRAIDAADQAFPAWRKRTAEDRGKILMRWHDLLVENQEEIAEILTKEMGKPFAEAKGEILYSASFIKWFAEEARRIYGRIVPSAQENSRALVMKQPIGVVASITPWNFPAAMIARKVAPALASGCTFVGKPANLTPLTAIKMVEYAEEAGVPKGVLNLIVGKSSAIGSEMTSNTKVRKLTFTGSTEVGKTLMKQSAETMQNLSLELGGHAPIIICDDADVDLAVDGVIASKFRNAGQTCICGNRIYVQRGIADVFTEAFAEKVRALRVGNGMEEGVDIGPVIEKASYDKIAQHVEDAVTKGAEVVAGGKGTTEDEVYFFEPTVLSGVNEDMIIMKEETFGPVAPIQLFDTDEEAVRLANNSRFGLAAYFFTEHMARGMHIGEGLEFGIIGWNDGAPSMAQVPFGGMKESGMGREGGIEGIEAYLETKYMKMRI